VKQLMTVINTKLQWYPPNILVKAKKFIQKY